MIGLIAKKDFLLNLLSVRFMIGFVLCLLIIPFTIVVGMDGYLNQMRIYKIDQAASETRMNQLQAYSFLRPQVISEPQVLSIFSNGISNNVGNKVKVNLGEIPLLPEGHASSRDNPLLNAFLSIDFATVIAIVISLLALVFAYDTITREREDGTMKLAFTGQVSRINQLIRQHHVQQWISWISPSELFGQAAEALCQTHVDAFLSYMDSQRKYRETIIRYLTDRDLFASARYITDQREETYPTQQEIEDFQAGRGGRSAEPKSEYFLPAIDTQDIPRYVPQQPTVGRAFGAALGRLTALLGLVVALLLGTIGVFMKYDVR